MQLFQRFCNTYIPLLQRFISQEAKRPASKRSKLRNRCCQKLGKSDSQLELERILENKEGEGEPRCLLRYFLNRAERCPETGRPPPVYLSRLHISQLFKKFLTSDGGCPSRQILIFCYHTISNSHLRLSSDLITGRSSGEQDLNTCWRQSGATRQVMRYPLLLLFQSWYCNRVNTHICCYISFV